VLLRSIVFGDIDKVWPLINIINFK